MTNNKIVSNLLTILLTKIEYVKKQYKTLIELIIPIYPIKYRLYIHLLILSKMY